jgi:hypothetical protein
VLRKAGLRPCLMVRPALVLTGLCPARRGMLWVWGAAVLGIRTDVAIACQQLSADDWTNNAADINRRPKPLTATHKQLHSAACADQQHDATTSLHGKTLQSAAHLAPRFNERRQQAASRRWV